MERPISPDDLDLLTDTERDAISVSLLPRLCRGAVDKATGMSKQARYNARKRAQAKLLKARLA